MIALGDFRAGTGRGAPTNHPHSLLGTRSPGFRNCNHVIRTFITPNKNHQHLPFSRSQERIQKRGDESLNSSAPKGSSRSGGAHDGTPATNIILKRVRLNSHTLGDALPLCPQTAPFMDCHLQRAVWSEVNKIFCVSENNFVFHIPNQETGALVCENNTSESHGRKEAALVPCVPSAWTAGSTKHRVTNPNDF